MHGIGQLVISHAEVLPRTSAVGMLEIDEDSKRADYNGNG